MIQGAALQIGLLLAQVHDLRKLSSSIQFNADDSFCVSIEYTVSEFSIIDA